MSTDPSRDPLNDMDGIYVVGLGKVGSRRDVAAVCHARTENVSAPATPKDEPEETYFLVEVAGDRLTLTRKLVDLESVSVWRRARGRP
jgi:hypothetical protein